ncbi:WD repeat-containing protein 93 [Leuresthes tenuis]|uniref:WD repeat-containing protein 93 n=1 Tax=Leuresthes tenuis TaxID=355514 RepID=UPI003B508C2B
MKATCKAEKFGEITTLELPGASELPANTNCLACSEDGRYLCVGHSQGLSVWCASSLIRVAEWLQEGLEITFVQMTKMAENTYLLGTVDDMGVARVFAHHSDGIHLLSVINIMEDVNKRSICLTLELLAGGHCGAVAISCNDAVWLEVYQFPTAAWLEEFEMVPSQKQDPNLAGDSSVKWSPVTLMMKVTPPKLPAGGVTEDPLGTVHRTDYLAHFLALDAVTGSSPQGRCTQHFLLPCGQFPDESEAHLQPAGMPVAVAVWWTGSHNLLQYSLQKAPKNKPDVASMPDVLWPNAKEILCSAVSRCTRYVALGLDDALVCVWDRRSGAPLSMVAVPAENSTLLRMQFVDCGPMSAADCHFFTAEMVHLLVLCENGAMYTVATGQGTQSCRVQLVERPKDPKDLTTITMSVPHLRGVSLVVQRSGKMFLLDVINKATVCFLAPPTSYRVASPCNPVYALNTKQQALFIRGDWDSICSASSEESRQSQLFVFHFGHSEIIKQYLVAHEDFPQQQITQSHVNLDEMCNLYLQQRVLSADERNKAAAQTWEQLPEIAATLQQRQPGCRQL